MFVFYSVSLLCLEFIYSLDLTLSELPEYKEIGLVRHQIPILNLAVKTGLLACLLLTLRQFISERRRDAIARLNFTDNETPQGAANSTRRDFNNTTLDKSAYFKSTVVTWIHSLFVKYWILLSSGTLLLMSCQNDVVAYRIGYMALFLCFITTFQVNSIK
jgi:hypothetical protein